MPTILLTNPKFQYLKSQLEPHYDVHHHWGDSLCDFLKTEAAQTVDALVPAYNFSVDKTLFEKLPALRIIANFGAGYDAIDFDIAKQRKIMVTNTPDVVTDDTADLALALILSVSREIVKADQYVRSGQWLQGAMPYGRKVSGKTIGIIGLGEIGRAIAKRAKAFDMSICYHGPNKKSDVDFHYFANLQDMAQQCDYLVLSCPGGERTKHIVNQQILDAMPSHAYLINISRGSTVDEQALLYSLQNKQIAGAGLDVFEKEPHVPEALLNLDNVTLLPHQGTATHETRAAISDTVVNNVQAFFAGKTPPNLVLGVA